MSNLIIFIIVIATLFVLFIRFMSLRTNKSLDRFYLIALLGLAFIFCSLSTGCKKIDINSVKPKLDLYPIYHGHIETVHHPNGCTFLVFQSYDTYPAGTMLHDPTCNNPKHTKDE